MVISEKASNSYWQGEKLTVCCTLDHNIHSSACFCNSTQGWKIRIQWQILSRWYQNNAEREKRVSRMVGWEAETCRWSWGAVECRTRAKSTRRTAEEGGAEGSIVTSPRKAGLDGFKSCKHIYIVLVLSCGVIWPLDKKIKCLCVWRGLGGWWGDGHVTCNQVDWHDVLILPHHCRLVWYWL